MSEWISVKQELPKHNQYVLCTNGKFNVVCWADIGKHDYLFMIDSGHQFKNVTHWMPLPEPPETEL